MSTRTKLLAINLILFMIFLSAPDSVSAQQSSEDANSASINQSPQSFSSNASMSTTLNDYSWITTGWGWKDSYAVNGKCYCDSTFDHGIGNYTYQGMSVRDICSKLGSGPQQGRVYYNTIQCGHEPGHADSIHISGQKVQDEKVCPGRVGNGVKCNHQKGPKWDLSFMSSGSQSQPSGSSVITVYDQTGLNPSLGTKTFGVGIYKNLGRWNNDIESMKVPSGLKVKVCDYANGGGACAVYSSNVNRLPWNLKDKVSYIQVVKSGTQLSASSLDSSSDNFTATSEGTEAVETASTGDILLPVFVR